MDASNYTLLYDALKTFRDAMLPFIISRLKETYGNGWWHDGVKRVLGDTILAELEAARERRYRKPLSSVAAPELELYEQLDVNRFVQLVDGNWRAFAPVFGQRTVTMAWLGEINDIRNAVAHPETGDISAADAARAVDTMKRILRVIDADAAERISATFTDLVATDARHRGPRELRHGKYDYDVAFLALEEALEKSGERAAADLQAMRDLRHELAVVISAEELTGEPLEEKRSAVIAALDELTRKVLQKSVAELAVIPLPETPNEAHARIREVEAEIDLLEVNLRAQRQRRATQQQTRSIPLPSLERSIARTERMIARYRREIEHIRTEVGPAAFFRVTRDLALSSKPLIEEQRFIVTTQLANLGRHSALVSYEDRVSNNLRIIEGSPMLEAAIAPGSIVGFRYTCEAVAAGVGIIETAHLAYAHRTEVWDELAVTEIGVEPARPPCLEISRYLNAATEILLRVENHGDRAARNVVCHDVVADPNGRETRLDFEGDVAGHGSQNVVAKTGDVSVKSLVTRDTVVTFTDAFGATYSQTIRAGIRRQEAVFPKVHADLPFVDLDGKLREIEDAVSSFHAAAKASIPPPRQRLLRIQGMEGAGKSRLVYELKQLSRRLDLHFADTDLSRVRPVRRLVARAFGVSTDLDDGDAVAESLRRAIPDDEKSPQREAIGRFITDVDVPPEHYATISGHVQAAMRDLARDTVLVLAVENVQAAVEGIEAAVLCAIINHALGATTSYVLPCITHRPALDSDLAIFSSMHIPDDQQWRVDPAPLDGRAVAEIADRVTHYPRISESLCAELAQWSHGNPLYVIEALRDLFSGETLLEQIGDEYYLAADVSLEKLAARGLYDVVASRAKNELSAENAEFARTLAAIGFELPSALTKAVIEPKYSDWPSRIERLVEAGVLVPTRKERRSFAPYEFEHRVKHRVFSQSLSDIARLDLEAKIATILLDLGDLKYRSAEDQIVEAARHICAAATDFQCKHAMAVVAAARIETKRRNFNSALTLYNAVANVIPPSEPATAEICIERACIHVLRGERVAAGDELDRAAALLGVGSRIVYPSRGKARQLEFLLRKEQGLLTLQQPASPFNAQAALERACHIIESPFGLPRLFPPARADFYRDLVDIYVGLAESSLRRGEDRRCRRYCKRAARLANKARRLHEGAAGLQSAVYQRLGRLHAKRRGPDALAQACRWYDLGLKQAGDDPYERERILVAWADALVAAGHADEAVEKYEEAITLQAKLADVQGLALSYSGIAEIIEQRFDASSARRDMADRALSYYERAYELRGYILEIERVWRICAGLTRLCLHNGDVEGIREYWSVARTILFDQNHIDRVSDTDLIAIHTIVARVTEAYERRGYAEDAVVSSGDLTLLLEVAPDVSNAEKATAHLRYGNALAHNGSVQAAIAEYEKAAEQGASADAHERLGDLFAVQNAKRRTFTEEESKRDEVEMHYEQSVHAHLLRGNIVRASAVFEKLLRRMTSDASGIPEVPLMFIRVFDGVPGQMAAQKPLLERSISILDGNGRPADAADLIVEALHHWLRSDDGINEGTVAEYLTRAEELYRKTTPEELIAGLHNLVSVDYKLNAWQVIVRRFEELFELQMSHDDPEELIESMRALWLLRRQVPPEHMLRFVQRSAEIPARLRLEPTEARSWRFWRAKLFITVGMKKGHEALLDQGLAMMDEIISSSTWEGDDLVSTAYNDTAVAEQHRDNFEEAARRFDLAIKYSAKADALLYANRGGLLEEMGDLEQALEHYETAYEIATAENDVAIEQIDDPEHVLSSTQVAAVSNMVSQRASIGEKLGALLISTASNIDRGNAILRESVELLERFGLKEQAAKYQIEQAMLMYQFGGRLSLREIVTPDTDELVECGQCSTLMRKSTVVCPRCGRRACPVCRSCVATSVAECPYCRTRLCQECGAAVRRDEVLCANCTKQPEEEAPPPPLP